MKLPVNIKKLAGATLIELVFSIVIISVCLTGVMMVITQTVRSSADPMLRTQATAIAQSYMEEILSQPLTDPSGADTGGIEFGETRATFDDVTDYSGLNNAAGAVDQLGNLIADLAGYNVQVSITDTTLSGNPAKRIFTQVTFDGNPDFVINVAAYRFN